MPNCQSKHAVPPPPKSQYELERDARIKRNKAVMASLGFEEGAPTLKKAPPKPRAPKPYVPESERRRSPRLAGETAGPERLTYDLSDDEGPKRPSQSSRRKRVLVVDDLSDEQRAALPEGFTMDAFIESPVIKELSEQNRRSVIRQVRKLVSGTGW